jgi:ATP-binding protein involved in chromosome partitioning
MSAPASVTHDAILAALAGVQDPEIHRPITELRMVESVAVDDDGTAHIGVLLTVAGCPMRNTLERDVTTAVTAVAGVARVAVTFGVMSAQQRQELQHQLRGASPEPVIPFAQPSSRTRVYAVASGKGGVGKSSVTVNLAAALATA